MNDLRSDLASPAVVPLTSLERDPLKKNFKNFMWKTWRTLFDNAPTALMYELGERLEEGPSRDVIMGYRGLSKSYITVDFGIFTLYRDPTEIVLTVSGSGDGAKGNASLAYSMINTFDWLAHMKPRGDLRASAQAFDVVGSRREKSESFAAMSLFGQITGRRASLIIPDDVETPNTSATEGDRQALRTRYAELGGSILKPGGKIKVLGTAQTEQTLYLELATKRGYGMRMWPVLYPRISLDPKKDEVKKYGPWLAPSILKAVQENPHLAGTSVDPGRFDEADLLARQLEYGATEFDRQFRLFLDAGAGNDQPLKLKDLLVLEIQNPKLATNEAPYVPLLVPADMTWSPSPELAWKDIKLDSLNGDSIVYAPQAVGAWQTPEAVKLIVDPSGEGKDETAWGVMWQHVGRVGLQRMDARLEGFSEATMKAIAADAYLFRVSEILIEKNYGGGMFGELLRPHILELADDHWPGCTITEENAGQVQKEVRIVDTLTPTLTAHRLVIAAAVLREDFEAAKEYADVEADKRYQYRLTHQLTRITKKKGCLAHDDRLDMVASGVKAFIGSLSRQLEDAAKQAKEDYLLAAAEKMIEERRKQGLPLFGLETNHAKLGQFTKSLGGLSNSPLFKGRKH